MGATQPIRTSVSAVSIVALAACVPDGKPSDWWIIYFTGALVVIGFVQFLVYALQARRLRQTIESNERAVMPFLYPRVSEFNLHPRAESITDDTHHLPTVQVRFENMGRTPAVIRRIRAELFVYERENLPLIPPRLEAGEIQSDAVISTGQQGGNRRYSARAPLDAMRLRELAARATGQYRRCYLIGYVVYDDFFDTRHTRRFCLKLRQTGFQAARGGRLYNDVVRERTPADDKLGTPTEDE